jgi:hypothetical protein
MPLAVANARLVQSTPTQMQILRNTTDLQADLCVATDKQGFEHCVVVAKGSFTVDAAGTAQLAEEQMPLVYADLPLGDPEHSSTAWETDFAPYKPLTDVIVVGKAIAPGRIPTTEVAVRLEIAGRSKDALVFGDRRWISTAGFVRSSPPVAFVELPLTWERAFGGAEEPRNLVGAGLDVADATLPNVEDPRGLVTSPSDRPRPRGFAWVGRSWRPRSDLAGTYDHRWRSEVCPLLPEDFDPLYFQAAPEDQQFPHFRGGERIRCVHMADDPVVEFCIPMQQVIVHFDFGDHLSRGAGVLDTVLLEPHRHCMHLSWRTSTPLTKQIVRLRGVYVGEPPMREGPVGRRRGKPLFAGLGSYVRWVRQSRGLQ